MFSYLIRALMLCFALVGLHSCANAQRETSLWEDDLTVYAKQLEDRHIELFHTISKADFLQQLELITQIDGPNADSKRLVALMRLTRQIGDGHTSVPLWGSEVNRYPVEFTTINGSLYVSGTTDQHADLLGAQLIRLNGLSANQVVEGLSEVVPFTENKNSEGVRTAMYLPVEDLLVGLGFAEPGQESKFEFEINDETKVVSLIAIDRAAQESLKIGKVSPIKPSEYFEIEHRVSDDLWLGSNADKDIVYIQMSAYPDYPDVYQFGERTQTFIDSHLSKYLIIDLRDNFGGDFFKGLQLASYLNLSDSIRWQDGVYVLVGPKTFSAAMSNAVQFKQILNAKLVGQSPGAKPCGYQDMGQFNLPNSGLLITYSKRHFCFIDTHSSTVPIDWIINESIEDYLGAEDRVLESILKEIEALSQAKD